MIDGGIGEEAAVVHREADRRGSVVAAVHFTGKGIAVRRDVQGVGDAVVIAVRRRLVGVDGGGGKALEHADGEEHRQRKEKRKKSSHGETLPLVL